MNPSPRRKSSQDLPVTQMIRTGIPQVKTFAAEEDHHLASSPALAGRRARSELPPWHSPPGLAAAVLATGSAVITGPPPTGHLCGSRPGHAHVCRLTRLPSPQ
jgi:hypothetical protein